MIHNALLQSSENATRKHKDAPNDGAQVRRPTTPSPRWELGAAVAPCSRRCDQNPPPPTRRTLELQPICFPNAMPNAMDVTTN